MRLPPILKTALILARRLVTLWVVLLAATALLMGGARHDQLLFRVALAASTIVLCVASWLLRDSSQPGWLRSIELIFFNLAVFLMLGEASLRLLNVYSPKALLLPRVLDSFRLEPGRDYGAGLRGNRLGYPGPDHPLQKTVNVYRVAALGDSFAIGPAVAYEDNYLSRLQQALPALELLNFGVAGTGPREYLEILQTHALAFKPDLVLVSFFVGNDVTEALAVPRGLDPRQFLLYLAAERGLRLLNRPAQHSDGADRLAGAGFSESQFLDIEARRLEVCRSPEPEILKKKWERALARMDAIVQMCAAAGARCAVVLIPDEFQVDAGVREAARMRAGLTEADLEMDGPQKRLRDFLADRDTPCLDLLPVFQQNQNSYAPRDTHWNARGNHLAAEAIARWLSVEGLVPVNRLASAPPPPIP